MKIETMICERLFPEIPKTRYDAILFLTAPNGQANAYTKWFCKQYLKNPDDVYRLINPIDKREDDISDLVKRHSKLYQAKQLLPIDKYNSLDELIVAMNKVKYQTNSEKDSRARGGAKVIGSVDGYNMYYITSYEASKKYGSGTTWCTTAFTTKFYYDTHKSKKLEDGGWQKLIYAINEYDEKYAFSIVRSVDKKGFMVDLTLYDKLDRIVGSYDVRRYADWSFKLDRMVLNDDYYMDTYNIKDESEKELLTHFIDWAIKKFRLSKEDLVKDYEKQFVVKEDFSPENKRYNRLLKNYVIRANKQLKNGIEITDKLKDEILDFYNKKRINFNMLPKMEIIYRCPTFIAKKYIDKFQNEYNIKYNPEI